MSSDEPREQHHLSPRPGSWVDDLTDRLPIGRAVPLALVETLGLAILFALYAALDSRDSVLAPLLVPLAVSFVLIVANSSARGARPLRVRRLVRDCGLRRTRHFGDARSDISRSRNGRWDHDVGHAPHGRVALPAIAVAMIAVLADFSPMSAASQALPLLVALAALVVSLAWVSHRILGDAEYPSGWW